MSTPAVTTPRLAGLDRRFYAFTIDRLLVWVLYGVAAYLAWVLFWSDGRVLPGLALVLGTVAVLGVVTSFLVGLVGTTPGKAALGLRVVDDRTGSVIGVGPALLRTAVLGAATLPTAGLGV